MKIVQCSNNHFYDSDKYSSCPHCGAMGGVGDERPTMPLPSFRPDLDDGKTVQKAGYDDEVTVPLGAGHTAAATASVTGTPDDDGKTVSIFNYDHMEGTSRPTVGWLVCVKGMYEGRDFPLKSGCNFIGRDGDMDVCLSGERTVARNRHAAIIYEPKQNIFLVRPGESRELFYLEGEVVLEPKRMKKNDVMEVGNISLMLIPCCDENFVWPADTAE